MAEWQDITWTTQEVATEGKLDGQQGNADFLRDVIRNRVVFVAHAAQYFAPGGVQDFVSQARLKLRSSFETTWVSPAVTFGTQQASDSWTRLSARNIAFPFSGLGDDNLYLEVQWRATSGSAWATVGNLGEPKHVWTADQEGYLSFWFDIIANHASGIYSSYGAGFYVAIRNLAVVFSLQNEVFA